MAEPRNKPTPIVPHGDHLDAAVLEPTVEVFLRVHLLFVPRVPHMDLSHDPLLHHFARQRDRGAWRRRYRAVFSIVSAAAIVWLVVAYKVLPMWPPGGSR